MFTRLFAIFVIIAVVFLAGCSIESQSLQTHSQPIKVYYAGPHQTRSGVLPALQIAVQNGYVELVTDSSTADVLMLNGTIPDAQVLRQRIKEGAGLGLFLGPDLSQNDIETLLGYPVKLTKKDGPVSITEIKGLVDPILKEIVWNGAPQVRERFDFSTPISSVQPLVTAYEDGEWVLWRGNGGREFIFNAFLTGDVNPQIQEWPYFNYLVYHIAVRASGQKPLSFAEYPGSPVPHNAQRNLLIGLTVLILLTAFGIFLFVRRYSLAHPEALEHIVSDRTRFTSREEGTQWEEVGFHRPLGGFLLALTFGLLLFIPLIIYQNVVLPVYILPSAQALGIWGRVTQFFNLAWAFFDMGTSIALVKYLSQYRVHDPQKGIQYVQVYVWWQALSGAVQVALVIALASTLAPYTGYAVYAWSVIIHSLIQIPGFYQVMRFTLNGLQREDYARFLDIALNLVMPMLVQPVFVTIMYAWGRANPTIGAAMGGLLGLGIAAYAAELFTFLIGLWLYRRIGYNSRVLFLAHFDWEVIKNSFKFGVFEMLGSLAWSAGQAAEIWITQARLINYTEIWGNWGLAQNFIFAFNVLQTLMDGVMPAISEGISNGRKLLSQYYSVMSYKWGGIVSIFLGAVLLAVADRFILGASGPEFVRAAGYVIPLSIWGSIQYASWVGDTVQLGANRPYIKSLMVLGEQIIRVILAWVLLERFQINALIIAYFVGLFAKGISAYFINNRFCFPQRYYVWQSFVAPILAGCVHYYILRWVTGLIWQNDQLTSILIFLIGVLPSFPVYMFLYGLFGGWDADTLDELKKSAALTGFIRPLAWLIWASTMLGTRVSPLHGRFPITIRAAALLEAQGLTAEKVKLS